MTFLIPVSLVEGDFENVLQHVPRPLYRLVGAKVLDEVKTEVSRRKNRFAEIEDKRNRILAAYKPSFDPSLPGILDFSSLNPTVICDDVYSFPAFDPAFCDEFMKEIGELKLNEIRTVSDNQYSLR